LSNQLSLIFAKLMLRQNKY